MYHSIILTIRQALKKYSTLEIELLLARVLREPKEFVFLHPEKKLSPTRLSGLSAMIKRRQKGEPLAYIVGYKDFYGLRFTVNHNVLIPRPETEWFVERIMNNELVRLTGAVSSLRILDVGTGSGAIAISLAKALWAQRLKARVFASDISKTALAIAKRNARARRAKQSDNPNARSIRFVHSDLLEHIHEPIDIIIANLPYLPRRQKELRYEPPGALYSPENGLKLIRRLLEQIAEREVKPKLVYLEFDPRQKVALAKLIKKNLSGAQVEFYKDFNNFWRYAEITLR